MILCFFDSFPFPTPIPSLPPHPRLTPSSLPHHDVTCPRAAPHYTLGASKATAPHHLLTSCYGPPFPFLPRRKKPPDNTRPSRAHTPRCPSKAKATTFVLSRASPCRAPCTAVHRLPSRPLPPGGRRMRLARGSCLYHHPLYSRNRGPPYPTLPPSSFLCTCRELRKFSFVVPTT